MRPQIQRALLPEIVAIGPSQAPASTYQFYLSGSEALRVTSQCAIGGVVITIQGRYYTEDGKVAPFTFRHTPNSDRTLRTESYPLSRCIVSNVVVYVSTGTPPLGSTWIDLSIVQGTGSAQIVLGTLLQGYTTANQKLSWPGSPLTTTAQGGGYFLTTGAVDPGAGNDFSRLVVANARWEMLAVTATLTTSAAAGNRYPVLRFTSGGNGLFYGPIPAVIPASTTIVCAWTQGGVTEDRLATGVTITSLPIGLQIASSTQIHSVTTGLLAGDVWSSITCMVREWLEN